MISQLKISAVLVAAILATGCAGKSATEADFGNSTRNMIAKQAVGAGGALRPDEPIQSGDGRRLEGVDGAYTSNVGDASRVVNQTKNEGGAN